MIIRIMMRILFIGVPILVVVWLMFLIGIQVYITPFYTYYFDGNMERKINNTTIGYSITRRLLHNLRLHDLVEILIL